MSTIAICIPAYNAVSYLPRILGSVNSQLIPFDEILVYDDCSTDETALVAEQLGARVIRGAVNKGCSTGKNTLAGYCTSEWIHFHDVDDDLSPNFTTLAHEWIRTKGSRFDVLLLNFEYRNFNTGELMGRGDYDVEELHADPLKYTINRKIVNFGLYNRQAFLKAGGFDLDPRVLYNEDNAFHQNLAKHGLRFDYLAEVTCINYYYEQSMSKSNQHACAISNYWVLRKTADEYGAVYPRELGEQVWRCIGALQIHKDWDYISKCIRLLKELDSPLPLHGHKLFKVLASVDPMMAVKLREYMIRIVKPELRNG